MNNSQLWFEPISGADSLGIRRAQDSDWTDLINAHSRAFGNRRGKDVADRWQREVNRDDIFVAEETRSGRRAIVGTVMFYRMSLTVPGRSCLDFAGVGMGLVAPTHQRHGIYRKIYRYLLDQVDGHGIPLMGGMPSKGGIYRRFGLGPSAFSSEVTICRGEARLIARGQPAATVREIESDEARDILPAIYDRWVKETVGAVSRSAEWWDNYFSEISGSSLIERYFMVHEDGYLTYTLNRAFGDTSIAIGDFCAVNDDSHTDLWQAVLGLEMFDTIRAELRIDDPIFLKLTDMRSVKTSNKRDVLWMRLVNIAEAMSRRGYASDGSVIVQVSDPFEISSGTFELVAENGVGHCVPTNASADIHLSLDDLSSLYLGAISPSELSAAGRMEVLHDGALRRLGSMLRTDDAPFCNTYF
ncbi:GNAT family N-acetyltransferase [Nocardia salmonicida]|uniref:GNAT family N-acetyltransferase n=1 Tax=Nocardia salmonicida TaxID=53431 RepID=UPI003795DC78